jgi:hypothetical protein
MAREAVFVVGLVVLGALFVLAVQVARLRARVLRHERAGAELSRTVGTVQGWATRELRALRDEFTVARVDASAEEVLARLTTQRAAAPTLLSESGLEDEGPRDTVAMPAPVAKPGNDDGDATTFLDRVPPMYAKRSPLMRPPAPLAHSDLIGSEDAAEEAALSPLDPDELTPPRRGRSAVLVPAFRGPGSE